MKRYFALACLLPLALHAHTLPTADKEALRAHILEEFMQKSGLRKVKPKEVPVPKVLKKPLQVAGFSAFDISSFLTASATIPPAGNGSLMQASFSAFTPKVRLNWDGTTFFVESDNMPNGMPDRMVGITTWQQQIPLPTAYFASVTNNENDAASLGFGQPNYWRIPLVPTVSSSPITIYNPPAAPTHFLRGAVALASNGVAIFNPANNTGQVSYEIGELDFYGGHCGLADDYHYHIIPTHLNSRFGGPLGDDKPVAWGLDGYPIYGFLEPDGTARQALDADGGHDHGGGWGYHYHAVGTTTVDATHPYGTPQSPYMMKNFHGNVVEYPLTNPTQVDGQPEVSSLRANPSGGYNAKAVAGAYIVAQMNPAPLVTDGSGNLNLVAGVNLTNCATTAGSTTVTCADTTGLTVGLAVVGYGVSNNATVVSVTNATQFVLSKAAIATTTGKNFTAVSLAGASPDMHLMRVNMGGVDYDECWIINRKLNPRTLTVTWRAQALISGVLSGPVLTTTNTYIPTIGSANHARLTPYPMGAWSEVSLPDTSQTVSTTATFGEDSDYTTPPTANPQSFTNNGNGTITDNVTGLMWQSVDAGEMTWENAINNASAQTTGGYTDWRLPNPHELFSIMNHQNGNPAAMDTTYFPLNGAGAEYWWSRDPFGNSTTNVWCVNSGGGLGPKPKAETISAGGAFRYHARYVRGAQNNNTHNYVNNGDGTITDSDTSLMWTQLPSSSMPWDSALTYAESLTTGGYSDWRMPNIKELQTLTDYALATTSGGTATNLKPPVNRTLIAKTLTNVSTNSGSATVTCADTTGMVAGMVIVDPYSVAGAYISNTTAPTVASVLNSTTFTLSANAAATGSGLIFRALPRATAYWSSTSNKGTTTEAWVLELGVNNSSAPPRGSQGIISYEVKTSSYPVFAVRTTTLTTSIAVSQGATSLTDGLSTVAYGNVNVGSSLSKTFTINNTGTSLLNITGVTIDGTNSANFSVTSPPASSVAAGGSTTFTVLFNALTSGNKTAALHIASDDAGNPSFDINLSGIGFVPPPTISNITINPISPSSTDPAVVTAQVTPGSGGGISGVSLTYDLGAQVTANVFRETFAMASSNSWTGTGGLNTWTTAGAGATRQANLQSNRTSPVVLTNCTTTNASTSMVCSSTATAAGNFSFTVEVTDSAARSATKAFTLAISAQTLPNVVIIVTDDQGWADIGYNTAPGQVPIQTPTMDSFATSGIRFERFYATTVCSVTRQTLLTGRNAIRTGVNNTRGLDLSEHIMPQTFKAAGYQTFMVGKWHLGGSDKNLSYTSVNGVNTRIIQEGLEYAPFNRGWDSHYGQYSGAIDYYTHWSAEADNPDHPDWWLNGVQQDGPSEHTDSQGHGGWSPDLEADKAVSHIQNRDPSKPMLLYLAFNSIHGPISAPASLITKYQNLGVTNTSRRLVCAAIDGMDAAMGRVLNALDSAGITNNTLVIWFSDNGGDLTKGSLNLPLRGDKGDSYEGGMHMPGGARWPGVLPAGVTSHQYFWVGDVFPTVCAATGVTPQNTKPLDGVNLWPNLLAANNSTTTTLRPGNKTLVTVSAAPIAINKFTDPVNGGTKDFKLIRKRVGTSTVNELSNLTDDLYETTDLLLGANAGSYTSIVTTLTNDITSIAVENYKPYIGPPLISNAVPQGGSIELYAPFTSYKAPTVQWRKNGVNISNGGNISGATSFTQVTDTANALVTGAYTTKLVIANASASDAATYDVVVTNTGGTTTSASGVLTVTLGAPVLTASAYTKGTSITLNWTAVASATSYTIQRSATSDFATILGTQTTSGTSATFTGLTSGTLYYYRGTATDGTNTSAFGTVVSSTQDASTPVIVITTPANNTTTTSSSIVVSGTASDTISPLTGLVVNGVAATTSDGFATWAATVPLTPGANTITSTSTDSADQGGNTGTASISVTYNASGPAIVSVSTGPTSPTYLDPTYVLAQITPQSGTTLTSVQLQYDTGTPVSTAIWKESFNNTSSNNWNGTGALNAWTTVGAGNVRQAVSTSNRTSISLTSAATTSGSTSVTCASTAALWPGMLVTGPNIAGSINGAQIGNTTVASITNATTFVLSQAATGTGTGLTLTACGVTLTNATTTAASVAVTCDNTAGLVIGMSLTGTGLANNATVASVTSATTFNMNVAPTTAGSALTLSATTAAAEFNGGTADPLASMFTTTNAINTTGASGFIEFYVQTRDLFATNNCGWTMQVSSDNGATWNTRLSEDWNAETISLSNVVINSAGAAAGSTTVTCTSTAGLTTGRSVLAAPVNVTIGITTGQSTATCTNTTGLVEGMFITATGIPNNTRVGTITPNTSFTLVTGTTATLVNATATNASAAAAANYFAGNATVSSITNATTFVLNTAAYSNTSAAPITTAYATTVNHGYQLFHYDFAGAELGTQTKIRFQATGYTATAPTRTPRIDVDDIVIATTAPPATITLTMFDDGNHGDGAANDGIWGAAIPAQTGGTTINFTVTATDSNSATSTSPGTGNYTYTVASTLADGSTIKGAEFLGMPKDTSMTINVIFGVNQEMYVEYGTQPGKYTATTTPTTFNIDNTKPEFYNPAEVTITGLQPDTEYYYRVRHRDVGAGFFNARGEHAFHTARPRGTTFSFTVTADPHLDVNTDQQLFWRAMQNISIDNPDFHIDLGDIFMTDKMSVTDGNGIPVQWSGSQFPNQSRVNDRAILFRNQFERCCHSIPFFFTLGNHEAEYGYQFTAASDKENNIPAWDLKARKAFYPTPVPDTFFNGNATPKDYSGGTLGLLEDYYTWEWGEALFIVLDPFWNTMTNPNSSNNAWNWSLGQAQYNWLRDTLKNSSAKYKFVFMHHIVGGSTQAIIGGVPTAQYAARGGIEVSDKYEWGGKNADGSAGFATNRPGWDMPIHDLLVANKVNVVFHGHDHLYGYQVRDGIVYLECPQPGTANYSSLGSAVDGQYVDLGANSTSQLIANSGHIRVTVGANAAIADYVRSYRTSSDIAPSGSPVSDETASRHNRDISHSFTLTPKTFAPIEVANVAPGQVGLRWNAVPNKPYQIQWSTDLVNWTTIDTLTFSNTNTNATYTDSLPARVNGQRAFYRVVWTP